jgi:hypothetical protein
MRAVLAALGFAALLSACSSPSGRISKNVEVFAEFPPAIQEKVRKGKVELGFTEDMVFIARGKPDREYVRQTQTGTSRVWSYVDFTYWVDRQRVAGEFQVRDPGGGYRTVKDSVWVDVRQERELEKVRIEFRDGRVVAIENVVR